MSQRQEWRFEYPAKTVLEAARQQVAHHASRLAFWSWERAQAETQLRESGITMREAPVTGGVRLDAVTLGQMQARLSECAARCRDHKEQEEEYATYVRALEANPDAVLVLDVADLTYFGM